MLKVPPASGRSYYLIDEKGDGKMTRAELRKNFAHVKLGTTILGTPISFTDNGDLAGAKKLLARLDQLCTYACPEEQELRRWIDQAEKRVWFLTESRRST